MVKIIHMADTHLGYRARRGTINKWAIKNYSKPYEQEIYDIFLRVMEEISNLKNIDFLVHCGDMFHMPNLNNPFPPPEPARRVLKTALDIFFKNTKNLVPFIYIEGNHGIFRGYDYTPFESHINEEIYPNLFYYKEKDLLDSIKENRPLSLEFNEKNVRFYLFPYFEFESHESYKAVYNTWIDNQQPPKGDSYINIAVAHGSLVKRYNEERTIHKKVEYDDFNYDYIALGHQHGLKEVTKNRYYSGSLLPLNFKECYENQGYLIVNINDQTKKLDIDLVYTHKMLTRSFEMIPINVSPKMSSEYLKNYVNEELNKFTSKDGFNPKTSARLKINFTGELTFEKVWQINEFMTKIRRDIFSQEEKYNILQLVWKVFDISESIEDDITAGTIKEYILEKPDEEFKDFVIEKLTEDRSQFDINKLTKFGMKAIKSGLKIMEKEKEV
ncbi:MAG: exonuclease SbcCD subunit D [Promethearchaeota archaeon]